MKGGPLNPSWSVLLSFAQFEREVTAERIRDKIAASKKKGLWMGGLVPLGYDAKDRNLVVNEAEAETIAERRDAKRLALVAEAKEHPLVQAVMMAFPKAEIKEVRTPEDIAAMAVFLASPRAANITGQTINVDGGQVMHW